MIIDKNTKIRCRGRDNDSAGLELLMREPLLRRPTAVIYVDAWRLNEGETRAQHFDREEEAYDWLKENGIRADGTSVFSEAGIAEALHKLASTAEQYVEPKAYIRNVNFVRNELATTTILEAAIYAKGTNWR